MIYSPVIRKAVELRNRIYQRNAVGCCLHIVTDDGNLKDSDVQFCLKWANKKEKRGPEHDECRELAALLLSMSQTQRRKFNALRHAIAA